MSLVYECIEKTVRNLSQERLGYTDSFNVEKLSKLEKLQITALGGGFIVSRARAERIDELHIIPHGGIRITKKCCSASSIKDPDIVAQAIFDNCDIGTGRIAMVLSQSICKARNKSRAIAFFGISRIILDANRHRLDEQVPTTTTLGTPGLNTDLTIEQKEVIAGQWLYPWLHEVFKLIIVNKIPLIIHHHSYDRLAENPHPLDQAPGILRPSGMLFEKPPILGIVGEEQMTRVNLIDAGILHALEPIYLSYLKKIDKTANIGIDWPYMCPPMPYVPEIMFRNDLFRKDQYYRWQTVVYEIRKDFLVGVNNRQVIIDAVENITEEARNHLGIG